ncbi:hypothetical protein C7447_10424 [Tenacibaculum adriaticum]|uniref:Uncharacterized protein n=1 Tax=Tenacibaculum adriaticum TaxID=413713 RepID=A0A5S5DN13_9FLAO|nr:hypothetical protein [Tenacibaculum adriaticum]TYP97340.1 hypothetical protein C7447_10424 [Tenacibaculum adriaticum]
MIRELNYFLKLAPILQQKICEGNRIVLEFNKVSEGDNVGESREILGVKNFISIVSKGKLVANKLTDLIKEFKAYLVGKKNTNNLDVSFCYFSNLSMLLVIYLFSCPQKTSQQKKDLFFSKTEMRYVLNAN